MLYPATVRVITITTESYITITKPLQGLGHVRNCHAISKARLHILLLSSLG